MMFSLSPIHRFYTHPPSYLPEIFSENATVIILVERKFYLKMRFVPLWNALENTEKIHSRLTVFCLLMCVPKRTRNRSVTSERLRK